MYLPNIGWYDILCVCLLSWPSLEVLAGSWLFVPRCPFQNPSSSFIKISYFRPALIAPRPYTRLPRAALSPQSLLKLLTLCLALLIPSCRDQDTCVCSQSLCLMTDPDASPCDPSFCAVFSPRHDEYNETKNFFLISLSSCTSNFTICHLRLKWVVGGLGITVTVNNYKVNNFTHWNSVRISEK